MGCVEFLDKLMANFLFKKYRPLWNLLVRLLYSWFRASWLYEYINKIQRDETAYRCLSTAKPLYMFRVSIAPIVGSTSNCTCSFWYRSYHRKHWLTWICFLKGLKMT